MFVDLRELCQTLMGQIGWTTCAPTAERVFFVIQPPKQQ